MMRIPPIGAVFLLLPFLCSCVGMGAAPSEQTDTDGLCLAALFQTESGDVLHDSAVCFATQAASDCYQVNREGKVTISGLPRNGELLLTLFDRQEEIQGTMTLFFDQGAVIDAMTDEDGVGHITVRDDTSEMALIFILTEDNTLRCKLWLTKTVPTDAGLLRLENGLRHPERRKLCADFSCR